MTKKEDIKIRSYQFSLKILNLCKNLPNKKVYWTISDQLLRSAMSIGANIVEARSSSSLKEFVNFYQIALKSANETQYWLCLLRDGGLEEIDIEKVKLLLIEAGIISRVLAKSVITMKKNLKS